MSPLRYPGSKRRLAGYVAEALRLNDLSPSLLVEPFAGSASVSLQLLNDEVVEMIALGEKDRLIASFWREVFGDCRDLLRAVELADVTVERWRELKSNPGDDESSWAFACLFLNRTSYSGILKKDSGPIGGYTQTSKYRIDCRFPKETLMRRIRAANQLRDSVLFVHHGDWRATLTRAQEAAPAGSSFLYLDPPFYQAGGRLYTHSFAHRDHLDLCHYLSELETPWMVSYDPADEIVQMYTQNGIHPRHVSLLYTAGTGGAKRNARELIITNLERIPSNTRLWRSSAEWSSC